MFKRFLFLFFCLFCYNQSHLLDASDLKEILTKGRDAYAYGLIKMILDQVDISFPDYEVLKERIENREFESLKIDPEAKETPEKIITDLGLEFVAHQFHTKDKYIITTW